ncbi:MAG TPA: glycosyltransferase [Cyanobacteria bacterium UBA8553]|nr:glycosyltransferase [Cyanobacteria bacterium UBA8553]
MLKTFVSNRWFHPMLLLVWITIGTVLRFTQLSGKPPWTDEFATMVFSLGNSYNTMPLDQAISLETLLSPLRLNPSVGVGAVLHHLLSEDHHPPLYFVLAHWWMQLFPASGEYISLWVARSLPALFGVASILAIYGLSFLAFRSWLVAQLAAAIMAVSPFGIFLAQEARHYTLGILWVIASLCFLVIAVDHLKNRIPLSIGMALCWVVFNSLGIATHYFFCLTLCAEAIVLVGFRLWDAGFWIDWKARKVTRGGINSGNDLSVSTTQVYWRRIYAIAAGTFIGCLVWVPVWHSSAQGEMTQWIRMSNPTLLTWLNPFFQSFAAWITMLFLLPVEAPSLPVVISSGLVMLLFFIWAAPILYRGIKFQLRQPETCLATRILGGFVLGAIAIFFSMAYFLGIDLTRGARYSFVYFPAVIVLIAAALSVSWNASKAPNSQLSQGFTPQSSRFRTRGKTAVVIICVMGLLSGITVVNNLGYQKYYRPDLLVPVIQHKSTVPVLIATTHNTLVQTGEMMGIAWEFKRSANTHKSSIGPQFLLAHQKENQCDATACRASLTLQRTLAQLPRPLDVWLVNFKAPIESYSPNCFAEDTTQYQTSVNGYSSRLYHCLAADSQALRSP